MSQCSIYSMYKIQQQDNKGKMDVVSIVVIVIVVIIMLGVSFYMFAVYCHPEDKGIGTSLGSKILIIFSQALAWGQLLLIPLDVSNSLSSSDNDSVMGVIYPIIFIINFVLSAWVIPFTVFLYETDEDDSWCSRICWSSLFAFGIAAVWSAVVFVSYIWLSHYTTDSGVDQQLSIPMYIMTCLAFVGWIFLSVNGGIGIIFMPLDLIVYFFDRPKKLSSDEAYEKKLLLQKRSVELINVGEKLINKEEEWRRSEAGWFSRRKLESQVKSSLEYYKKQVNKLEEQNNLFYEELQRKDIHPIRYCVSLFFGILASIVSLAWLIQLLGTTIQSGGIPIFSFLDPILTDLAEGDVSFLAIGLYSLMVLYLQGCAVKGNLVFGLRIPFILNYHPMKPNKTYLNSFLFNVNMMMLTSVATTQLTILAFPTYLESSYLGELFADAIFNLPMFGWLYSNRIFMGVFCIVSIMSIFVMIYRIVVLCLKKGEKNEQEQTTT